MRLAEDAERACLVGPILVWYEVFDPADPQDKGGWFCTMRVADWSSSRPTLKKGWASGGERARLGSKSQ